MERIPRFNKLFYKISFVSFLIGFFGTPYTLGGIVLVNPPPVEDPGPAEKSYPVSRFGEQPSAPQVAESRRPAGLTYEDEIQAPKKMISHSDYKKQSVAVKPEPMNAASERSSDSFTQSDSSLIPNGQRGVQELGVIAGDIGFFPKTIFVNPDIPVRMFVTGTSKTTLCIMMDQFQVRKQVKMNEIQEITFTPRSPGTYRFYCPINGMEGSLVVREVAAN